jgi:hypothetical protein
MEMILHGDNEDSTEKIDAVNIGIYLFKIFQQTELNMYVPIGLLMCMTLASLPVIFKWIAKDE